MSLRRIFIVLVAVFMAWVVPGEAQTVPEKKIGNNSVLLPAIPRGQGDHCVADADFMRRNHMTMLMHQRDETVRQGIRGKPFSLKECVACHAVEGPDAMPVTVASPQHFCRACHDYAAVSIDCFQCHASRPDVVTDAGGQGGVVRGAARE